MMKKKLLIAPLVFISFCAFGMELDKKEFEKGDVIRYRITKKEKSNTLHKDIKEIVDKTTRISYIKQNHIKSTTLFYIQTIENNTGKSTFQFKEESDSEKYEYSVDTFLSNIQANNQDALCDFHNQYLKLRDIKSCIYKEKKKEYVLAPKHKANKK